MRTSIYGSIISFVFIILSILPNIIKPKRRIRHLRHYGANNIKLISYFGIIFFGIFNFFNIEYNKINNICTTVFIISYILIILIILLINMRFIIKKQEEYKYKNFIYPIPYSISYSILTLLPSILLFNPIVLGFSIAYSISYIYIDLKEKKEVFV